MAEPLLRTESLARHFGGLAAVGGVSIECSHGQIHAIIGPNGAGKTTLINLLSGDLKATRGRIVFAGTDITGLDARRKSRMGIGRSYQKTNIFLPFSVLENCRLAAQSRLGSSMRFFRPAHAYREGISAAEQALDLVGLEHRAADRAGVHPRRHQTEQHERGHAVERG